MEQVQVQEDKFGNNEKVSSRMREFRSKLRTLGDSNSTSTLSAEVEVEAKAEAGTKGFIGWAWSSMAGQAKPANKVKKEYIITYPNLDFTHLSAEILQAAPEKYKGDVDITSAKIIN